MLDENTGEYPTSGFSTVGMQELSHENWNGIFSSEIASLLLSHRKVIPAAAWSMVNLVWMDWHAHSNMSTPLHPFWQYGPAYNRIRRPDGSKHGWAGTLVDIWTVHSIPPSAVYNMLWCLRYLLYKKLCQYLWFMNLYCSLHRRIFFLTRQFVTQCSIAVRYLRYLLIWIQDQFTSLKLIVLMPQNVSLPSLLCLNVIGQTATPFHVLYCYLISQSCSICFHIYFFLIPQSSDDGLHDHQGLVWLMRVVQQQQYYTYRCM